MNDTNSILNPIPTVSGWPIIGNTKSFIDDPIEFLVGSYNKYGPVFRMKTINQDIIVLAGLEANKFLSKNANELLTTKEFWGSFVKSLDAETILVALDGPPHANLRKVLMRGYSPKMIANRFPTVTKITEDTLAKNLGKSINVVPFVQRLITEQLGYLLTNKGPGSYYEHLSYFIRVTLNVTVLKMWPKAMLYSPRYRNAKKKINELSSIIVKEHKENKNDFPDLVDDILSAQEQGLITLTPEDLVLSVVGPFFAGMDTVTNTISVIIYALAQHPDVLTRIRAEVDEVFENGLPDLKNLKKMEVTHRAVLEALRRYPVTPIIPRTAVKDFVFANCQIKAESSVYMAQVVPHFLPELFKNPYDFDIDRFAPPREEHRQRFAFNPYGLGAHRCLGAQLGEIQMILTLATLVQKVNIELVPKNYKLKMRTLPTIGPEPKFSVKFSAR